MHNIYTKCNLKVNKIEFFLTIKISITPQANVEHSQHISEIFREAHLRQDKRALLKGVLWQSVAVPLPLLTDAVIFMGHHPAHFQRHKQALLKLWCPVRRRFDVFSLPTREQAAPCHVWHFTCLEMVQVWCWHDTPSCHRLHPYKQFGF